MERLFRTLDSCTRWGDAHGYLVDLPDAGSQPQPSLDTRRREQISRRFLWMEARRHHRRPPHDHVPHGLPGPGHLCRGPPGQVRLEPHHDLRRLCSGPRPGLDHRPLRGDAGRPRRDQEDGVHRLLDHGIRVHSALPDRPRLAVLRGVCRSDNRWRSRRLAGHDNPGQQLVHPQALHRAGHGIERSPHRRLPGTASRVWNGLLWLQENDVCRRAADPRGGPCRPPSSFATVPRTSESCPTGRPVLNQPPPQAEARALSFSRSPNSRCGKLWRHRHSGS